MTPADQKMLEEIRYDYEHSAENCIGREEILFLCTQLDAAQQEIAEHSKDTVFTATQKSQNGGVL